MSTGREHRREDERMDVRRPHEEQGSLCRGGQATCGQIRQEKTKQSPCPFCEIRCSSTTADSAEGREEKWGLDSPRQPAGDGRAPPAGLHCRLLPCLSSGASLRAQGGEMEACHLPHLQSAEDTTCRPSVCVPAGLHLAIFSPGHSNFPRKQEGGNAEHIPLFHPNHQI